MENKYFHNNFQVDFAINVNVPNLFLFFFVILKTFHAKKKKHFKRCIMC